MPETGTGLLLCAPFVPKSASRVKRKRTAVACSVDTSRVGDSDSRVPTSLRGVTICGAFVVLVLQQTRIEQRRRSRSLRSGLGAAIVGAVIIAMAAPAAAAITHRPRTSDRCGAARDGARRAWLPCGCSELRHDPSERLPARRRRRARWAGSRRRVRRSAILTNGSATLHGRIRTAPAVAVRPMEAWPSGATRTATCTVLKIPFTVPAGSNCLSFDFKFLSDEYPEFVESQSTSRSSPSSTPPTGARTAARSARRATSAIDPSSGKSSASTRAGNTSFTAAEAAGTTYDGATPKLSASKAAAPVCAHAVSLDLRPRRPSLGFRVFVDGLSVGFVPNPTAQCVPGATPFDLNVTPATATNQVGTQHTVPQN